MGAKESRPSSTSDKNRPSASPAATGTVTANTAEEETRHAVTEKESERLYLGFKYNLSLEERGKDAIVVKENREEGGRGDDRGRCNLEKDVEVVVRDHVTNNKYGEERREEAVSEEGSKEGGEKEKEAAWEEELNEGREVKGGEEESGWLGGEEEKLELPCYTQRSNAIDCTFYLKTGTCAYNNNSKFNNPPDRRNNKMVLENANDDKIVEEFPGTEGLECKTVLENVNDEKVSELVLVTVEGLECKIVPENGKTGRRKKKVRESMEVQNCEMALENANDYNILQDVPGTVEGPEYKTISENANGDKTEEEVLGKDEGLVPKMALENANDYNIVQEVPGTVEGREYKTISENANGDKTEEEVLGKDEGLVPKMALENANDYNIVQEVPGTVEGLRYKTISENANGDKTEEEVLGKDEGLVSKMALENANDYNIVQEVLGSVEGPEYKTISENANGDKTEEEVLGKDEGLVPKMALENANDYNIVQEVPGTVEGPEYKTISENANGDKTEEEVLGKDEGLVSKMALENANDYNIVQEVPGTVEGPEYKTISENANGDKTEEVLGKDEGLVPKIVLENAKRRRRKKKVTESTEIQNCEMALENANDYNIVQEVPGTVEGLEYKTISENANGDKTEEKLLGKDEGLVPKYSLSPAGSRSGSMSKFRQQPERYRSEPVELNFMGLPIRRAEKNCFYYMRTGSCKFSTKCRYHHPEPTEVGESDSFSDALPSYTSRVSTTQNLLPHLQGNDYEHPLNSSISLENGDRYSSGPCFSEYQQSSQMTKLPQEPGQSASSYYMKSRNCINTPCKADYPKNRVTGFRTYHHPRNRTSDSSSCLLSPTGLPLRPGRSICQQYSLHGTCKFGRTCVYDHSDLTLLD